MKFPIVWPSGLIEYVTAEHSRGEVVLTLPLGIQTVRISRRQLEHFLGREVPEMGATDQPTSQTATNTEPGGEGPKPRQSG